MDRVALGLSVHTGWAACVVASGSLAAPRVIARERIEMLGEEERFVFHRAEEMPIAEARRSVERAKKEAHKRAEEAIARIAEAAKKEGAVVACAIVAKGGAMPALEEIVSSHPRIHTSEGLFYRDALAFGAEAAGLRALVVAPGELEAKTAAALGVTKARVPALIVATGRAVGKPWAKDQKQAALAAWLVLA